MTSKEMDLWKLVARAYYKVHPDSKNVPSWKYSQVHFVGKNALILLGGVVRHIAKVWYDSDKDKYVILPKEKE